jgi:hypothetical protein
VHRALDIISAARHSRFGRSRPPGTHRSVPGD